MNDSIIGAEKLRSFVAKIATLRSTGGGWIVVGDEPFLGESNRVVNITDLAREAKELLAFVARNQRRCKELRDDSHMVTENEMHDLLVAPHAAPKIPCYICKAPHTDKRLPTQMAHESICDECDQRLLVETQDWMRNRTVKKHP